MDSELEYFITSRCRPIKTRYKCIIGFSGISNDIKEIHRVVMRFVEAAKLIFSVSEEKSTLSAWAIVGTDHLLFFSAETENIILLVFPTHSMPAFSSFHSDLFPDLNLLMSFRANSHHHSSQPQPSTLIGCNVCISSSLQRLVAIFSSCQGAVFSIAWQLPFLKTSLKLIQYWSIEINEISSTLEARAPFNLYMRQ